MHLTRIEYCYRESAWISTFDGMCETIIERHGVTALWLYIQLHVIYAGFQGVTASVSAYLICFCSLSGHLQHMRSYGETAGTPWYKYIYE